ncbi:MAG: NCS1 family nucleobase:cation symporter-1 [Spirochaetales bacterium]|nr:NCS1 family nucleobase:cation symporter-1 [Spirochaetales bacterium]
MSLFDQKLHELKEDVAASPLYNEDLAPTRIQERTWNKWNFAALWVGMAVCIPTYLLAADMLRNGLSWLTAILIILAGNVIVAVPMVLNAHAGTKYGIPFPVFGRSVFGIYGVHLPAILRGIVACGWFGIQTWVGGKAIIALGLVLYNPELSYLSTVQANPWLEFLGFGIFWLIQMYFVYAGTESIKWLENWSAPILLAVGVVLLVWAIFVGGSLGQVLERSADFSRPAVVLKQEDQGLVASFPLQKDSSGKLRATKFRFQIQRASQSELQQPLKDRPFQPLTERAVIPGNFSAEDTILFQFASDSYVSPEILTVNVTPPAREPGWLTILFWLAAMVGYWATLALNIPDISRYAKSQSDQLIGQFLGLPVTMMFYSFIGVAATSAAIIAFDHVLIVQDAPWDPVTLISLIGGNRFTGTIGQFALLVATLSTNIAANIISPANSFANVWPKKISWRTGGMIAGVLGILLMPWKLTGLIAGFLITYGSVLGPVVAVMIADYYFLRKTELSQADLYRVNGAYHFHSGFNWVSIAAATLGAVLVLFSGQLAASSLFFKALSYGAWFSGFFISFLCYWVLLQIPGVRAHITGSDATAFVD